MKKLPKKTEKVLRDMAKKCKCGPMAVPADYHAKNCPDYRPHQEYVCSPHEHDVDKCQGCSGLWTAGEAFGRENHVVKQPAPIVHTVEKKVIVYKDMPTHWIHATWAMLSLILWAIGFIAGYGPNWAGPPKPREYISSPGAVWPAINKPVSDGAVRP